MRDPTRGGLMGVLHDLAEATRAEVWLDAGLVPVREDVKAACEMLGLDPCDTVNEGKMVIAAAADQADAALAQLRAHPLGKDAAIIGKLRPAARGEGMVVALRQGSEELVIRREGKVFPRLC